MEITTVTLAWIQDHCETSWFKMYPREDRWLQNSSVGSFWLLYSARIYKKAKGSTNPGLFCQVQMRKALTNNLGWVEQGIRSTYHSTLTETEKTLIGLSKLQTSRESADSVDWRTKQHTTWTAAGPHYWP